MSGSAVARRMALVFGGVEVPVSFDEADVPPYVLPDPLRFEDGTPVATAGHWERRRRELLRFFEEHVYGRLPAPAVPVAVDAIGEDGPARGVAAQRLQRRVWLLGDREGPALDLLVFVPPRASGPVPVFLGLNFHGNAGVHPDPAIALARSWMRPDPGRGIAGGRAGEETRGVEASRWPVEAIVSRGFALATAYCGDLAPDDPARVRDGILGALAVEDGESRAGAIAAWAFGLSRARDALATMPGIDAGRAAVVGHSRLGKAALLAGALDERFRVVISNDSGCGGAALSRRRFGETVQAITAQFPHWFAPRFARYAGAEDALPVDQHQLLALVAPRALYVASARDDPWADPKGEGLALEAAAPVWQLLVGAGASDRSGRDDASRWGRDDASRSARDDASGSGLPLGRHCREGGHELTAEDWEHFLAFAERHLRA